MDLSPAVVTRAELYEQVWAKPMLKLATEYRITATGLAKVCRKANIPVPPRGYWNKLKAGKPVMKRSPLPPGGDGRGERISIQPSSPSPGIDPVVDARTAAEQQPENRIQVSDQLRKPHPLIQDASAALSKARADKVGLAGANNGGNTTAPILDIVVSPAARHRALRLLDALLKALEARGYAVSAHGVTIEGQIVPLGVVEKQDRKLHVPTAAETAQKRQYPPTRIPNWDYAPNGRLSIHTSAYVWWRKDLRKRWSDGRTARLEDMLNDIVAELVAIGAALRQRDDEQRREAEARAEQERQRQERARQARMEKARRENLVATTEAWTTAERIRHLVAEVERRVASTSTAASDEVQTWIAWATGVANDLDPLAAGLDKLLQKHQQVADAAEKPPAYGYNSYA